MTIFPFDRPASEKACALQGQGTASSSQPLRVTLKTPRRCRTFESPGIRPRGRMEKAALFFPVRAAYRFGKPAIRMLHLIPYSFGNKITVSSIVRNLFHKVSEERVRDSRTIPDPADSNRKSVVALCNPFYQASYAYRSSRTQVSGQRIPETAKNSDRIAHLPLLSAFRQYPVTRIVSLTGSSDVLISLVIFRISAFCSVTDCLQTKFFWTGAGPYASFINRVRLYGHSFHFFTVFSRSGISFNRSSDPLIEQAIPTVTMSLNISFLTLTSLPLPVTLFYFFGSQS